VLGVDLDPQGQLAKVLGVESRNAPRGAIDLLLDEVLDESSLDRPSGVTEGIPRVASRIPGLDLVVGSKALGLYTLLDSSGGDATGRLAEALDHAAGLANYDFVLIDAPPSFGPLTLNVLRAVGEVVIPVPLTYLALDGCAALLRTIDTVRTRYGNPDLRITMVVPTFYRRTRLAHELLDRLKARFPKEIAQTVLGYHVKIDEAQSRGLSIVEYAPRDRAAQAIGALAEELELRAPAPIGGPA